MSSRTTYQFCNNCGKQGHLYNQCKKPIISSGIIAFRNNEKKISANDTIIITVLSLPVLCFFASLPFYFDNKNIGFDSAFFEAT